MRFEIKSQCENLQPRRCTCDPSAALSDGVDSLIRVLWGLVRLARSGPSACRAACQHYAPRTYTLTSARTRKHEVALIHTVMPSYAAGSRSPLRCEDA